jgi:hypothetical protein
MKAKLIVDGHEFDIDILDPKLQELITPKKKTGYERVGNSGIFYLENDCEMKVAYDRREDSYANASYERANYYSSKIVAENNIRADKLMRQLRRFAVEHRENELVWEDYDQCKFFIAYECNELDIDFDTTYKTHGVIYFDSLKAAELAIETFKDELIWYFTEYKDSL